MTQIDYSKTINLAINWVDTKFVVTYNGTDLGYTVSVINAEDDVDFTFSAGVGVQSLPPVTVSLNDSKTVRMTSGSHVQDLQLFAKKVIVPATEALTLQLEISGGQLIVRHEGKSLGVTPRVWRHQSGGVFKLKFEIPAQHNLYCKVAGAIESPYFLPLEFGPANDDTTDISIVLNLKDQVHSTSAKKTLKLNVNSKTTIPRPDFHDQPSRRPVMR